MADAFVRIGDPERSAATELLEGHLRAGRITSDDFNKRVQRIATCRTVRDLDQVMVGFQQLAPVTELTDLGQPHVEYGATATAQPGQPTRPGWYEVLDPWDKPLGQSPLTLRKVRRIGWVVALTMSVFTAQPISALLPSALEAIVVFSPILLMLVVSFWMAPNEKKAYRWVANPIDHTHHTPTPPLTDHVDQAVVGGVMPAMMPSPAPIPPGIPPHPLESPEANQPTPWTVEGPTFPTVGEHEQTPFDQDEPA